MNRTYLFPFFKEGKHIISPTRPEKTSIDEKDSQTFNNQGFESLTLEVKGAASANVAVYAYVDSESEPVWTKLSGRNLSDGMAISDISENGLYLYMIAGITHIKVSLDAAGTSETITGSFFG